MTINEAIKEGKVVEARGHYYCAYCGSKLVNSDYGLYCYNGECENYDIDYIMEEDNKYDRKLNDELSRCLECGQFFYQERDLQICDNCIGLFDTDKLWQDHDNNKIDALDFNESEKVREQYRIKEK